MKHEWRKHEKQLYLPKASPEITTIPQMQFITIKGKGNPNSDAFQSCVQALYSLAYPIKIKMKKSDPTKDYTVYPLEGVWDLSEEGRALYRDKLSILDLKDHLVYTLMIRQPNVITKEFFERIQSDVHKKKQDDTILLVDFVTIEEGKVCQMLHKGSYDTEPTSFTRMEEFCEEQGYTRMSKLHREIYISDPRKVSGDKLKTTLRFSIQDK